MTPVPRATREEKCATCFGSGEEMQVVNPEWPQGTEPHVDHTGEPCPDCKGRGTVPGNEEEYQRGQ